MSTVFQTESGQSRDHLIESHLPLVRSIARRYAGRGEAVEDLVQVGAIGLIRACDRFDPARGVAFATFAAPAIEGEIRRHLGDRAAALRIPRELQRMSGELQRCREKLDASLGRPPTVTELAAELGVDEADIERARHAERAREPSPASADEAVEATGAPESLASSDDRLLLARGARVLDERERRIVFLRFHADLTEQEIARELGISQAHVSRLLSGALTKLRTELNDGEADQPVDNGEIGEPEAISPGPGNGGVHENYRIKEDETGTQTDNVTEWAEEPAKKSSRSGRFLVRMPSALHEKLSLAAEREQVSLNRFVIDVLSTAVSKRQGAEGSRREAHPRSGEPRAWHPSPVQLDYDAHLEPESDLDSSRPRRFRMLLTVNIVVIFAAAAVASVLLILALQRGI